jgi:hypothetical protein
MSLSLQAEFQRNAKKAQRELFLTETDAAMP